ncbi:MAG: hypothetical protein U0N62_00575 [Hydrogeniiclostridium sp.]
MAYNTEKLVKLAALKALAEKVNDGFATQKEVEALSGRVDDLVVAGGEPNVLNGVKVNGAALSIAEKMVDILIAAGSANGTLAVNGANIAVKGLAALAYKAQVSEADLDAALAAVLAAKASKTAVDTLIGSDVGKSVRTIANEELAAQLVPEDAKESLDTLTEIAQWIQQHPDDAATMNAAITKLNGIVAGIGGEEDDYATVIAAIEGKISAAQSAIYAAITAGDTNGHLKVNGTDVTVYTHPTHTPKASGLYKVTVDAEGHVSATEAVAKTDITALGIPAQDTTYTDVTAGGASGLMSGADKTKLDGLIVADDSEVTEMLGEVFAQQA